MKLSPLLRIAGVVASFIGSAAAATCKIVSFSGGGSHGAFEAGVLSRMVEQEGFRPWDVHLGVSAGSLTVLSLLKDGYIENAKYVREIWSRTKTSDVLSPLSSRVSLSGNGKVLRLIEDTYQGLRGDPSTGVFRAGVTDLETGMFLALPLHPPSPDLSMVLASTSIPIVFPPVYVPSLGITAVDGGLQSNEIIFSGFHFCPEGSGEIELDLVFANVEENDYAPEAWNLFTVARRTVDIMFSEFNNLFFKTLGACDGFDGGGAGTVIRVVMPPEDSPLRGVSVLDFDHGAELWMEGYYNATVRSFRC